MYHGEVVYSYRGEEYRDPRILVVGWGDAGCRMVTRLANLEVGGAETLALSTDRGMMERIRADRKMLMGRSFIEGDSAGADPEAGRVAAERSGRVLKDALRNRDLVFVVAGLDGGTGKGPRTAMGMRMGMGSETGAASAICKMAKDLGATVVGIFTLPLQASPGPGDVGRLGPAEIEELAGAANTLILLDSGRVRGIAPGLSTDQIFSVMDQVVAEIVKGIVETIAQTSLINLDIADVKTIISDGGLSAVLVGESDLEDEADEIVFSALRSPMLEVEIKGAARCILTITGGSDLTLKKAATIALALTEELGPEANVIWGARVKEGREGKVGLLAVMTRVGISPASCQWVGIPSGTGRR